MYKGGGLPGEPERNILGETGEAYRTRELKRYATDAHPDWYADAFDGSVGWTSPPPEVSALAARLRPIVTVPGLAALTLRATGGPGWTGIRPGGDGLMTNGALGYTLSERRAFLAFYGVDPIDIPDQQYLLREIPWNLGPFTEHDGQGEYRIENARMVLRPASEVPRLAWQAFRAGESARLLADIYAALRSAHLPLFLDDRASAYTDAHTEWFGSWDAGDRLPNNPIFSIDSEGRAAARAASRTVIARWGRRWTPARAARSGAAADFARQAADAARGHLPPAWDGMALDLSALPTGDTLRLLDTLPEVGPGKNAAR